MKEIRCKFKQDLPYGLHDMRVKHITIKGSKDGASIDFEFEEGYTKLEEPYPQVEGSIEITGADLDFCSVNVMSKWGRFGGYRGEKLELGEFIKKYPEFSFEIVDELYAYNQVWYAGYLRLPEANDLREMEISMYYAGEIVYRAEE